jgi:hypothetical protein
MLVKISGQKGELREDDVTYDSDKGQLLRWIKPYAGAGLLPRLERVVSECEVLTDINTGRSITVRKPKIYSPYSWNGYKISDMSDEHILNAINYMLKNIELTRNKVINIITFKDKRNKSVSYKELEKKIMNIMSLPDDEFLFRYTSSFKFLVAEADKRGLLKEN